MAKKTSNVYDYWAGTEYEDTSNITKLLMLRRSVGNFVNIATGKHIPITFYGVQSRTNFGSIQISADPKIKKFDSTVGLALHEASHIKYTCPLYRDVARYCINTLVTRIDTVFEQIIAAAQNRDAESLNDIFPLNSLRDLQEPDKLPYIQKFYNEILSNPDDFDKFKERLKKLMDAPGGNSFVWTSHDRISFLSAIENILEDRRIDKLMMQECPGYVGYYKSLYNTFFDPKQLESSMRSKKRIAIFNESIARNKPDDLVRLYIDNIFGLMLNKPIDSIYPGMDILAQYIDLPNILRCKNTLDICVLSAGVLNIIFDIVVKLLDANTRLVVDKPSFTSTKKDCTTEFDFDGDKPGTGDAEKFDNEDDTDNDLNDEPKSPEGKQSNNQPELNSEPAQPEITLTDVLEAINNMDVSATLVPDDEVSIDDTHVIVKLKSFTAGDIPESKKLNKNAMRELDDAMEQDDAGNLDLVQVNVPGSTKSFVTMIYKKQTANSPGYISPDNDNTQHLKKSIEQGKTYGRMLGRKLKTYAEKQIITSNRLRHGKLDPKMLSRASYLDQIYYTSREYSNPAGYIELSIDASGSMTSYWGRTCEFVMSLAVACKISKSIDLRVNYRASNVSVPIVVYIYDSRRDSISSLETRLMSTTCSSATPEALCYDATINDMKRELGNRKGIFITITDGEPQFRGYNNYVEHTQNQVNAIKRAGYEVIALYIGRFKEPSYYNSFGAMYGSNGHYITADEITKFADVINNIFVDQVHEGRR